MSTYCPACAGIPDQSHRCQRAGVPRGYDPDDEEDDDDDELDEEDNDDTDDAEDYDPERVQEPPGVYQ